MKNIILATEWTYNFCHKFFHWKSVAWIWRNIWCYFAAADITVVKLLHISGCIAIESIESAFFIASNLSNSTIFQILCECKTLTMHIHREIQDHWCMNSLIHSLTHSVSLAIQWQSSSSCTCSYRAHVLNRTVSIVSFSVCGGEMLCYVRVFRPHRCVFSCCFSFRLYIWRKLSLSLTYECVCVLVCVVIVDERDVSNELSRIFNCCISVDSNWFACPWNKF